MAATSCDDIKIQLHSYAANCSKSEDYWDLGKCPLIPHEYQLEGDDAASKEGQVKLLIHGLSAVFAISLCSTFGALFVPLFNNRPKLFGYIMLFLMSLAVSALSGAATMVLIPEGLGLMNCDELRRPNLTVCLGILTFFIIRRLLHACTGHDDIFTHALEEPEHGDMRSRTTTIAHNELSKPDQDNAHCAMLNECDENKHKCANKKRVALKNIMQMKSVGWMTLLGDGAHNFLDGIAMGATFMHSGMVKGWQITIAILAEEFPHELGDYAVLLKAGLTPCEAIICNVISGLTCLLGFFVGWKVPGFDSKEVFSWMGGVFLFISLACMLPEVESTISDMNREYKYKKVITTAVAVAGFISGYAIVYCAGAYISFE